MTGVIHTHFLKTVKSDYYDKNDKRKGHFEHADLLISSIIGKRENRFKALEQYAESKRAWAVHYNEKIATCEKKLVRLENDLNSFLEFEKTENKVSDAMVSEIDSVFLSTQIFTKKLKCMSHLRDSCIKSAIRARTHLAKMHGRAAARIKFGDKRAEEWKNAFFEWQNVSILQASDHIDNKLSIANGCHCSARSLIENGSISAGTTMLLDASKKYFSAGLPSKGIALGKEAAELFKKGGWDDVASVYLETAQLAESAGMFEEAMNLYWLGEKHAPINSTNLIKSLGDGTQRCEEKISRCTDDSMTVLMSQGMHFNRHND